MTDLQRLTAAWILPCHAAVRYSPPSSGVHFLGQQDLGNDPSIAGDPFNSREQELTARIAELEQALQLRDEFLSIAAHELRNPMHSLLLQVSAAVQLARREGFSALLPRLERVQQIVDRYLKRATLLLDVARMSAVSQKLYPEDVDFAQVVREVADSYAAEAEFHQTSLQLTLPDSLHGRWDRLGVEQIVSNLFSNAIKFGAGAPIEVVLAQDGVGSAAFVVRDRGIGIDPADQDRIFRRFEQLRPPGARTDGAGLGLWLVSELVQAHGGNIAVSSAPNAGATFTVKLPIESPRQGIR
jgi:two-component system OmpR family sensor kinase